jgi:LmbE family N-acetylglucosaminyl deacetylase
MVSVEAMDRLALSAPALVFAPHPDDEVLGCGGTIALKADAGAQVEVVVMTDGRTSHSELVDTGSLIAMRQQEARLAAVPLGLSADNYAFLDFEDHCLREFAAPALDRVLQILRRSEPRQVFVPSRRDGLSDHVATYEIVHAALRAHGGRVSLFEYPVWLWHTWPWTAGKPAGGRGVRAALQRVRDAAELTLGCRARIDIRPVRQRKLDALAQYRSQMQRSGDDPHWPILADVADGAFLDRCLGGFEIFRRSEYRH